MTHDKGPSIHNLGSGDTQSHEPIPHRKTLGCSPQRTVATALVMSGSGPARSVGGPQPGWPAPALQWLTGPLLAITVLMLARGWWLAPSHGSLWGPDWKNRATYTLISATVLSATLWGLRFAGLLGASPL